MAHQGIIEARFLDTVLGCVIALLGGMVMHSTRIRKPLMQCEDLLLKTSQFSKDA